MTITGGAISGVDASFSKVKDEGTTETTTHTGTTVTASDTLTMQSGNDTTITCSQVGGKTVMVNGKSQEVVYLYLSVGQQRYDLLSVVGILLRTKKLMMNTKNAVEIIGVLLFEAGHAVNLIGAIV